MAENELKKLTVNISGRNYPLRVEESEIGTFKEIVAEINKKIQNIQGTYSNRDTRDCISMVLLTYAVDFHKSVNDTDFNAQSNLTRIDQLLDQYLQST